MATKKATDGEGSVYRRADGRWVAEVTLTACDPVTGKQVRQTAYGRTRAEAVAKLDEMRAAPPVEGGDQPLSVFMDYWLAAQALALKPLSQDRYARDIYHLNSVLGPVRLSALSALDIARAYQQLEARGVGASTRHNCGVRLRQLLERAQEMGMVRFNVAKMVPLPRQGNRLLIVWDQEQVRRFLAEARVDYYYSLYVVALDTAARSGELFALEWSDYDRGQGTLRITKSLEERKGLLRVKDLKTASSLRSVILGAAARTALDNRRAAAVAAGIGGASLFSTPRGRHLRRSNLHSRSFYRLIERAGVPRIRFHDLRHTAATLMLAGGMDVAAVAERMGLTGEEWVYNAEKIRLATREELV
jgi:integrase